MSFTLGNGLIGNNMFQAKRRKFGIGSLLVLLLIGGVFVVAGWAFYKSTQINPSWKRTNGTVTGAVADNGSSGSIKQVAYDPAAPAASTPSATSSPPENNPSMQPPQNIGS